jgi:hypothetical protein
VTDLLAALEATALAEHLRVSRWTYPLVNTAHLAGIGLLLGAVVPMDLRLLGLVRRGDAASALALLRPFAAAGALLAVLFGTLLFLAQPTDYVGNGWFRVKMALLALALLNALVHVRLGHLSPGRRRLAAAASLALWPAILLCGRMIGYT